MEKLRLMNLATIHYNVLPGGRLVRKTVVGISLQCVFALAFRTAMLIFPFQIIAIKLFSVSPSEMCDERTALKLSAFNSTKRNGLSPANLINMAKLQDYWRYGLGSPGSEHSATLKLPKAPKSTSVHLPTPTLQDLLNPAPPNDEPEFLIADQIGRAHV